MPEVGIEAVLFAYPGGADVYPENEYVKADGSRGVATARSV